MSVRDDLVPLTIRLGYDELVFPVRVLAEEPACVALAVRKSGSSVFSSIVNALADHNGWNTIDLVGTCFDRGIRYATWNAAPQLADAVWRGNVYIGFRDPPTLLYDDPIFRHARKILLVRDPRDVLVSEYFSNAFSHALPGEGAIGSVVGQERARALAMSLGDYVLTRVEDLNRTVAGYRHLLDDPELLLLRYEDVIGDKVRWISSIAAHFGWSAPDDLVAAVVGWADVWPDAEAPGSFIRRVAPGDHLEKLPEDVLRAVNARLSGIWSDFGYDIA